MLSIRAVLVLLLAVPGALAAQHAAPALDPDPWTIRLRATISGSSDTSEPDGYKIFSGVALEGAVQRRLGRVVAAELAVRTESREVLGPEAPGGDNRLGSLEMLPVTALLRWLPRGHADAAFQPYVGAGAVLTLTWEKSGALDSIEVPTTVRPALGLGADYQLSDRLVLNLDGTWHPLTASLTGFRTPDPTVRIDPLTLGLGLGVRF